MINDLVKTFLHRPLEILCVYFVHILKYSFIAQAVQQTRGKDVSVTSKKKKKKKKSQT